MDTPPRGALVRASGVRRPVWHDQVGRRRPSGQEPAGRRRVPRQVWVWAGVCVASIVALHLLALATEREGPVRDLDRMLRDLLGGPALLRLADDLDAVAARLSYRVLWVPVALVLVWFARWRHLLVYVGSISVIAALAQVAAGDAAFARAVRVGMTGSEENVLVPAWAMVVLGAVATGSLFVLLPSGRRRRWGWLGVVALLLMMAASRVALGLDSATLTTGSAVLGCSAAALAFLVLAPESDFPVLYHRQVQAHLRLDEARKRRVIDAVRDQLGIELTDLLPYRLAGSAGSTPCRLTVADGSPDALFGKLYAATHLRSDRWYKFFRVLRYGRLEDEAPFDSVRRLVEHEDYMLRLLRDGGVTVPEPVGVVEVRQGREYLLVSELVPDAVEILESEVSDGIIDDALRQIRLLWAAGAAHRDIKPSNVLAQGERVYLVDVSFGELRPSRWRQAVDLANMMLTLAVVAGPARVVDRATALFDRVELSEAFAATGSVTVPRQLHRRIEATGHDLVEEFRALLPPHARIPVQRWSLRRVLLAVGAVGGVLLAGVLITLNLRAGSLL